MSNLLCRIIGHKHSPQDTDSGYLYCKRCGAHEYYDASEYHRMTLIDTPKYVWWWIAKFYYKYKYRSRPDDTLLLVSHTPCSIPAWSRWASHSMSQSPHLPRCSQSVSQLASSRRSKTRDKHEASSHACNICTLKALLTNLYTAMLYENEQGHYDPYADLDDDQLEDLYQAMCNHHCELEDPDFRAFLDRLCAPR